jgi:hypothetical protein
VTLFGTTEGMPQTFGPRFLKSNKRVIVGEERGNVTAVGWKDQTLHSSAGEENFWCESLRFLKPQDVQTATHTSCVDARDRMNKRSGKSRRISSEQEILCQLPKIFFNTESL